MYLLPDTTIYRPGAGGKIPRKSPSPSRDYNGGPSGEYFSQKGGRHGLRRGRNRGDQALEIAAGSRSRWSPGRRSGADRDYVSPKLIEGNLLQIVLPVFQFTQRLVSGDGGGGGR